MIHSDLQEIERSYRTEMFDLICMENLKEKVNSISGLFTTEKEVLKQDVVVVANRDPFFKDMIKTLGKKQIFMDLQNIYSKDDTPAEYRKIV